MELNNDVIYMILSKIKDYETFKNSRLVCRKFYKTSKHLIKYKRNEFNVLIDGDFHGHYPVNLVSNYTFNSYSEALKKYLSCYSNEYSDDYAININQVCNWNGKLLQKVFAQNNYDVCKIDWDRKSYYYLMYGLKQKNNPNLLRYNIKYRTIKTFECRYSKYTKCYSGNEYNIMSCDTQALEFMDVRRNDRRKNTFIKIEEGCVLEYTRIKLQNPRHHILFWHFYYEPYEQKLIKGFHYGSKKCKPSRFISLW